MKTLPKQQPKEEELSADDLRLMLVELAQSKFWPAIKQYNRGRDVFISQSLRSLDPVKESTQIARVQGMSLGIFDLETGLEEELAKIDKEMAEAEVKRKDKTSG